MTDIVDYVETGPPVRQPLAGAPVRSHWCQQTIQLVETQRIASLRVNKPITQHMANGHLGIFDAAIMLILNNDAFVGNIG